ncbi:unnamed protein product [Allacma fusca]|uniref:Uncharacterized protein n=1 Tax=Allacma fusca TaxID=39272 RepID=A0A8J2LDV2_9HEXA|nr:unnamed protein product [Allacma fusca]
METDIIQIEACLNSRPISALSSDPKDLDALTPGHFITGSALIPIPEQNFVEEPISHLSRWKLQQKIATILEALEIFNKITATTNKGVSTGAYSNWRPSVGQ